MSSDWGPPNEFARSTIKRIDYAMLAGGENDFASSNLRQYRSQLVVEVEKIVRLNLVVPIKCGRLRIHLQNGICVQVVARAAASPRPAFGSWIWSGVRNSNVEL